MIMNYKSKLIQWLKSVLFLPFVDCCVFITFKLEEIFEWKWKCELVTLSISELSILNFAVHVENVFWASFNMLCQKCLCILFHSFESWSSRSRLKTEVIIVASVWLDGICLIFRYLVVRVLKDKLSFRRFLFFLQDNIAILGHFEFLINFLQESQYARSYSFKEE